MNKSVKMEKYQGSGGRAPRNIFAGLALQTTGKVGKCLLSFIIYCEPYGKRTANSVMSSLTYSV